MRSRGVGTWERIVTMGIAVVCIICSIMFVSFAERFQKEEIKYFSYVVQKGDTLWEIADIYAGDRKVRDVIEMIRSKNQIRGTVIYANDMILIPDFDENE